jgi:uncharacterized membrane protein affecting hemolysin expression
MTVYIDQCTSQRYDKKTGSLQSMLLLLLLLLTVMKCQSRKQRKMQGNLRD